MIRFILTVVMFAGLGFMTAATGASYHAAVNGKSNGNGTLENPWDLNTALNKSSIKGGDTLWIHSGTYLGVYKSTLQGSASSPVIIKAVSDFKAILDGNVAQNPDAAVLSINGRYVWYCGLTITNSTANHIKNESSLDPKSGVYILGAYNKLINCIIHNNIGNGIGFWSSALDSEVYGCIIYNNGYRDSDRGHGHGIYTQNETNTKLITDNILFNSYGKGLHIYTEEGSIKGYKTEGNVFFNSGLPGAGLPGSPGLEQHIIVGGTKNPADRIVVNNNYFYNSPNITSKAGVEFGYSYSVENQNLEFTNNYMVDGSFYSKTNWNSVKATGNSIISKTISMALIAFDDYKNIKTLNFNNNKYYKGTFYPVYPPSTSRSFDYWKSASGQDGASSYYSSEPAETAYFIRKNQYEAGRANLIIFNWKNAKNIEVDLSEILSQGDEYELYDVSYLSKGAISKGAYNGKNISVSMELKNIDLPNGNLPNLNQFAHTAPFFGVFVIKRASGSNPSTDIFDNTSEYKNRNLHIQTVYPNPATDNLTVAFSAFETSYVDINIIDAAGKSVHSEKLRVNSGTNSYSYNISHIAKGVYIINISDGTNNSAAKFVKM